MNLTQLNTRMQAFSATLPQLPSIAGLFSSGTDIQSYVQGFFSPSSITTTISNVDAFETTTNSWAVGVEPLKTAMRGYEYDVLFLTRAFDNLVNYLNAGSSTDRNTLRNQLLLVNSTLNRFPAGSSAAGEMLYEANATDSAANVIRTRLATIPALATLGSLNTGTATLIASLNSLQAYMSNYDSTFISCNATNTTSGSCSQGRIALHVADLTASNVSLATIQSLNVSALFEPFSSLQNSSQTLKSTTNLSDVVAQVDWVRNGLASLSCVVDFFAVLRRIGDDVVDLPPGPVAFLETRSSTEAAIQSHRSLISHLFNASSGLAVLSTVVNNPLNWTGDVHGGLNNLTAVVAGLQTKVQSALEKTEVLDQGLRNLPSGLELTSLQALNTSLYHGQLQTLAYKFTNLTETLGTLELLQTMVAEASNLTSATSTCRLAVYAALEFTDNQTIYDANSGVRSSERTSLLNEIAAYKSLLDGRPSRVSALTVALNTVNASVSSFAGTNWTDAKASLSVLNSWVQAVNLTALNAALQPAAASTPNQAVQALLVNNTLVNTGSQIDQIGVNFTSSYGSAKDIGQSLVAVNSSSLPTSLTVGGAFLFSQNFTNGSGIALQAIKDVRGQIPDLEEYIDAGTNASVQVLDQRDWLKQVRCDAHVNSYFRAQFL